MATRKRQKESLAGKERVCMNMHNGKCRNPERRGTRQCAKNRCNDFKDPRNPRNRR